MIARVVLPAQYDPGEIVLLLNENVSKSGPVKSAGGGGDPDAW